MVEFEILIINEGIPNILGLPITSEMNLVCHVDTLDTMMVGQDLVCTEIFDHYNDVFAGLGCRVSYQHWIILPTCYPPPKSCPY